MLSLKKLKETNKKKVTPGAYIARVTSVTEDPNTVGIGAFIVHYKITNPETGETRDFQEKFFGTTANKRTNELAEIMDQLGLDNLDDLVGVEFDIEIKTLVTHNGASFPSIVRRKPQQSDDTPTEEPN